MSDNIITLNDELIELIKQAIGARTIRQVEAESGISHGLLGKVLRKIR